MVRSRGVFVGLMTLVVSVPTYLVDAQTAGLSCSQCPGTSLPAGICAVEETHQEGSGCIGFNNCQPPEAAAAGIDAIDLGGGLYEARLLVDVTAFWNSQPDAGANSALDMYWTTGSSAQAPTTTLCEHNLTDRVYTYIFEQNLTCEGAPYAFGTYSLAAVVCVVGSSCERRTAVEDLQFVVTKQDLGCPVIPTSSCESCAANRSMGMSSTQVSGPMCLLPGDDGPGATLRYRAGGAGTAGLPGAADWATTLGTGWAHQYSQRIVPDPDDSHVWLITEDAVFREFGNLTGGVYEVLAPSDEHRTLERTGIGWLLHGLDGTVTEFEEVADGSGRWLSTTDRNGNPLATGFYDSLTGQLERVEFLDQRTELFAYYESPDPAEGKLQSITEVGIDGATTRTWDYRWSGDDLVGIDRPDGTSWEMTYDAQGLMTLLELVGTDATSRVEGAWEYDADGRVVRTWRGAATFAGGVDTWEFDYESATRTSVTDPLGQIATYDYERDPSGGDRVRVTDISGSCPGCGFESGASFLYGDPANPLLPTQQTDALLHRTDFVYDEHGQMVSRTDAVGTAEARTTTWEYDPTHPALVTEITRPSVAGAPDGRVTTITRDADGNPTERTEEGFEAGSAFALSTSTTFTVQGRVDTIDPPGFGTGDQTSFTYDPARGELIADSRTDPLIGTTTFAHDPFHRRTATTDPNGVTTETDYDALDRVRLVRQLGATAAEDLETEHVYTVFGDLDHTVLPEGNVIDYEYDAAGRLTAIERRPDLATHGERVLYQLDKAGNRTREEHQRWNEGLMDWETFSFTEYLYTTRCQLDEIRHPDGTVTELGYDCNGNLQQEWDANHPSDTHGPTATYGYDALDRLTTVTRPWAGAGGGTSVTTYQYDAQDHLTAVTDAEGNVTTYTYSDRDLLTQEVSPVSGTTTHTYNQHGALTSTTDARGITVTRTVDELDRVTFVDYPDDTLDTIHTYDDPAVDFSRGRLTAITRNGHAVAYEVDRFGRTTRDGELGFGYDKNGNRTGITYPDGVTAAYEFDFADREDRLSVATDAGATVVVDTATYFPSGPLHTLDFGTGVTETRTLDQRYFPETIALDASQDRTWTYATDDVGNVTEIVSSLACAGDVVLANETVQDTRDEKSCAGLEAGPAYTVDTGANVTFRAATRVVLKDGFSVKSGASFAAGTDPSLSGDVTRSYSYQDVDYFLTEATGPWGTKSWTYDRIGNRLTETDFDGTDTYSYTPNGAGGNTALLDSIQPPSLISRDFDYTPAGHQIQMEAGANIVQFDYDAAGRLEEATRSTETPTSAPFTYDGRSFLRRAGDLATTGTVEPLYDSGGLLHGLLRQPSAADPQTRYLILYFAGRPVAQVALETGPSERWWYLTTDHLGTPLVATDGAGEELWENRFEPFGRDMDEGTAASALASEVFLRFPGQWEDEVWQEATMGAEVLYNVHRWYQPGVGRYGRPDPLGLTSGLHTYLYARNNSLSWTDPLGLETSVPPPPPEGRDPFVPPMDPTFSHGPWGQRPNPDCCDEEEVLGRKMSVERQLERLSRGEVPSGTIGGAIATGHICLETGWCKPDPPGPEDAFNPFISPDIKDPCIIFCTRVHEWYHFTDTRWWHLDWDDLTYSRHRERPAYQLESACLRSFLR